MTAVRWIEAPLGKSHDSKAFDCGDPALNDYSVRFARQNHDNRGEKTILASNHAQPARILGFFSLSPASIDYAHAPSVAKRERGRYDVPVFRLGRLAVAQSHHGKGLGGRFRRGGKRCIAASELFGGVALVIDAKSDRTAAGCASFGAIRLDDAPLMLMLPLATLAARP